MADNELTTSGDEDLEISREITVSTSDGRLQIIPSNFRQVMVIAKILSMSDVCVPPAFRGNRGACLQVTLDALRVGASPFALVNQAYVTRNKAGEERVAYQAQAIHGIVNGSKILKKRLRPTYDGIGPERCCKIVGEIVGEDEPFTYDSPPIRQIGVKNSPLWVSDPDQQLSYYSTRAWARRHVPEVILGMFTPDDLGADPVDVMPPPSAENFFAPPSNGEDREERYRAPERPALAAPTEAPMPEAVIYQNQRVAEYAEEIAAAHRSDNPLPHYAPPSTSPPAAENKPILVEGALRHAQDQARQRIRRTKEQIERDRQAGLSPEEIKRRNQEELARLNAHTERGAAEVASTQSEMSWPDDGQAQPLRQPPREMSEGYYTQREAVVSSSQERKEPQADGTHEEPPRVHDEIPERATVDDTEGELPEEHDASDDGGEFSEEADPAKHDGGYHAEESALLHAETHGNAVEGSGSLPPRTIDEGILSWWRMAERDGNYRLRMESKDCRTVGRDQLISLSHGAPDLGRLERFATANQQNIWTIQLADKNMGDGVKVADQVRAAIDLMREELAHMY